MTSQRYERDDGLLVMEGRTEVAHNIAKIGGLLAERGAPGQIVDLMRNEAEPYEETKTLGLLAPALTYQGGRFARASTSYPGEDLVAEMTRKFLLTKAAHCVEAAEVVQRAIRTPGKVTMTGDERDSIVAMTIRLEDTLIGMARKATTEAIFAPKDLRHVNMAVNNILNPDNSIIVDIDRLWSDNFDEF
jgi:hypothetical protein